MSARDVIYDHIVKHPMRRDLSLLGISTEAVAALTAAGYRILGPDEVDPVTVERCAQAVESSPELAAVGEFDGEYDGLGRDVAAEVRSLGDGR